MPGDEVVLPLSGHIVVGLALFFYLHYVFVSERVSLKEGPAHRAKVRRGVIVAQLSFGCHTISQFINLNNLFFNLNMAADKWACEPNRPSRRMKANVPSFFFDVHWAYVHLSLARLFDLL